MDWETGRRLARWYFPANGIAIVATETPTTANNGFSCKFALTHITELRTNLPDFILADVAALFGRLVARPIHLIPMSHYRRVQPICRAANPAGVNHPVV